MLTISMRVGAELGCRGVGLVQLVRHRAMIRMSDHRVLGQARLQDTLLDVLLLKGIVRSHPGVFL